MKKFLFIISMLLLVSTTYSQEVENKAELKGEASASISALRLAADLIKYGYAQQSALPLINALQIISDNPTQSLKGNRDGEQVDTSEKTDKKSNSSFDFGKILEDAKLFADGDGVLMNLLTKVEEESKGEHRGNIYGPQRAYYAVNANSTDTYDASFVANSLAEVAVSGDGDTDLDLYVYDSNGNLIASDTSYSDDCYVRWVPRWTGRFIIKVVNRGHVYNNYVILTN